MKTKEENLQFIKDVAEGKTEPYETINNPRYAEKYKRIKDNNTAVIKKLLQEKYV